MALYYFVLKHGDKTIPDRDGEDLPDQHAARAYACAIARDLMRNQEVNTRLWRIEVRDEYLMPCFEIHFSEIDETLGHLTPNWREMIVTVSRRAASLQETMKIMRTTLAEAKGTLAKADLFLKSQTTSRND
jgi:hypothetical protein